MIFYCCVSSLGIEEENVEFHCRQATLGFYMKENFTYLKQEENKKTIK